MRKSRLIRIAAPLLALSLVAVACGDDDDPVEAAPDTTVAAPDTTVAAPDTTEAAPDTTEAEMVEVDYLSIKAGDSCSVVEGVAGLPARSLLFMPYFIAEANGVLADDLKLDLELLEMRVPAINAGLVGGDVDFSFAGGSAMRLALTGAEVRRVLDVAEVNATQLMAGEGIDSVQDLIGKDIGVSGGGGSVTVALSRLLEAEGIDPENDVNIVPLGGLGNVTAAIVEGQISAGMVTTPFTVMIERAGGKSVASLPDYFPGSPGGVATSVKNMNDNAELVDRMVWAGLYAMEWVRSHPEESMAWIAEERPDFSAEEVQALYEGEIANWTYDGTAEPDALLSELIEPGQPAPEASLLEGSTDYSIVERISASLDKGEAPC